MLQNLDDQIRDCRQRAANCAEQATKVVEPRERAEWLSLRRRYLVLADNIETKRRDAERRRRSRNGDMPFLSARCP
jgi:hypothetical protein